MKLKLKIHPSPDGPAAQLRKIGKGLSVHNLFLDAHRAHSIVTGQNGALPNEARRAFFVAHGKVNAERKCVLAAIKASNDPQVNKIAAALSEADVRYSNDLATLSAKVKEMGSEVNGALVIAMGIYEMRTAKLVEEALNLPSLSEVQSQLLGAIGDLKKEMLKISASLGADSKTQKRESTGFLFGFLGM